MGLLLNFSHPLSREQVRRLQQMLEVESLEVRTIRTVFDPDRPFDEQANELVDSIGLTPEEWQTLPLVINLPGLSVIAAVLLAQLHGRCGYFPAILRVRSVPNCVPPRFEVAEVINLQAVRDAARHTREG